MYDEDEHSRGVDLKFGLKEVLPNEEKTLSTQKIIARSLCYAPGFRDREERIFDDADLMIGCKSNGK